VIELGDVPIGELARRLAPSIRIDPQMSFETVTMTRWYVAEVVDTPTKVEFFLLNDAPHNRERFRRRRRIALWNRQVRLLTVEDVIITKLHWALLANRSKDQDDIRNVIAVQCDRIDWDYIHSWCEQHGTRELLDEIRRSVPPI
jgi:hypothetical protein